MGGVRPLVVVEIDPAPGAGLGLRSRFPGVEVDAFVFQGLSVVRCFETLSAAALRGLGSSGFDPMRRTADAASGDRRWSCV